MPSAPTPSPLPALSPSPPNASTVSNESRPSTTALRQPRAGGAPPSPPPPIESRRTGPTWRSPVRALTNLSPTVPTHSASLIGDLRASWPPSKSPCQRTARPTGAGPALTSRPPSSIATTPSDSSPPPAPDTTSYANSVGRVATPKPSAAPPTRSTEAARRLTAPGRARPPRAPDSPHSTTTRQHDGARSTPPQRNADSSPPGIELIDDALDRTRPERVLDLAHHPSPWQIELLGAGPASAAGQAVWCHAAYRLETHRDYHTPGGPAWDRLCQDLADTHQLCAIADGSLRLATPAIGPRQWAQVADHAQEVREKFTLERRQPISLQHLERGIGLEL